MLFAEPSDTRRYLKILGVEEISIDNCSFKIVKGTNIYSWLSKVIIYDQLHVLYDYNILKDLKPSTLHSYNLIYPRNSPNI